MTNDCCKEVDMKVCVLCRLSLLVASAWLVMESPAGEKGSHEAIVKDMLETVEKITARLGTITDQNSADAARDDLKDLAMKMLKLRKRAEDLKQPNKAEKDRLTKVYAPKFEVAFKELREQTLRVKGIPGGDEAVRELAVLNEKKDAKDNKKKDDK
jgi:hypothetical protein